MKVKSFLLAVLLVFLPNSVINAQFAGGSGTSGDPYQVATAAQLNEVRNYLSSHFIQTADIDLTEATGTSGGAYWNGGAGWDPIGTQTAKFTGTYDGNNKKITGMTINRPSSNNIGLFGVSQGARLRNILLREGNVTGHTNAAGLIGWPSGYTRIYSSSFTGSVAGNPTAGVNAGGIAGVLDDVDTIRNCWSSGTVSGYNQVGGFCGNVIRSNVIFCYTTATVSGNMFVGGFSGFGNGSWYNSYATGNITGNARVGGFIGQVSGGLNNRCYSTGSVPSSGTYIGGFIGYNDGNWSACYWNTQTSGTSSAVGFGNSTGISGKTTAEMKTEDTYVSWDFVNVWQIIGNDYPDLRGTSRPPVYDVHIYLTSDNNDVNANVLYPKVGFGSPITTPFSWTPTSPDWTYNAPKCTVYVVPTSAEGIVATSFVVDFDPGKAALSASTGSNNLFSSGIFHTQASSSGRLKVNAANISSVINVTPGSGKYLAMLVFTMLKPGNLEITLDSLDFRQYDTDLNQQVSLTATKYSANVKFYLGDFASSSVQTTGDGLININDLSPFATAYWSNYAQAGTLYKSKFDIGPTSSSGNYFALPTPDGSINFEDLIIFAIGYGKSAGNQLPKLNPAPINISLGEQLCGNTVRVPLSLSGNVDDVKGLSFTFNTSMKLLGVEKAGELNNDNGFVIFRQEGSKVMVDAALIGPEVNGISKEGVIAYLVFESKADLELENVIARNSFNQSLNTALVSNSLGAVIPETFSLNQNYPNPFNPSTVISFALPVASKVALKVYNSLGQEVATLINGQMLDAGIHSKAFDASNLTSGVYLYKLTSDNFTATRKMLMTK